MVFAGLPMRPANCPAADFAKITAVFKNIDTDADDDVEADADADPPVLAITTGPRIIDGEAVPANIVATEADATGAITTYHLAGNVMRWDDDTTPDNGLGALGPGVENG